MPRVEDLIISSISKARDTNEKEEGNQELGGRTMNSALGVGGGSRGFVNHEQRKGELHIQVLFGRGRAMNDLKQFIKRPSITLQSWVHGLS